MAHGGLSYITVSMRTAEVHMSEQQNRTGGRRQSMERATALSVIEQRVSESERDISTLTVQVQRLAEQSQDLVSSVKVMTSVQESSVRQIADVGRSVQALQEIRYTSAQEVYALQAEVSSLKTQMNLLQKQVDLIEADGRQDNERVKNNAFTVSQNSIAIGVTVFLTIFSVIFDIITQILR